MEKIYYLDNAATTKVFDEVYDLMRQNNAELFYNPSSAYDVARMSKKKLDEARATLTELLRGKHGTFYFTSSATESNNTVFEGVHLRKGQVVLISEGEHPAVYNAAHRLEAKGIVVKEIPLAADGKIDFDEFKKLMTADVALVSVMHVSNETGAVNDIKRICAYAKQINSKVIVHSDGVQAFGKIQVNLLALGVDLYSVSAHKIYAPRGVAGLWVKKGVVVDALLVGGGQEDNFRSSTENVGGAIAFAYSAKKVLDDFDCNSQKVGKLKSEFLEKLQDSKIAKYLKVFSNEECAPHIISMAFIGIKGEVLMNALQKDGLLVSTGSACSSKKAGNRTLEAMGVKKEDIVGSVRVSFSPYMEYDIDFIVDAFVKHVERFESNNIVIKG